MILVDTDVLIQIRRGDPLAGEWLEALGGVVPPIPGTAALEFLVGSKDRFQLERAQRFIDSLEVVWHTEADNRLAYELVSRYRLSTGLGLGDFFIAAQAMNLRATLFSFNLRHFQAIPGLDVKAPYAR